MRVANHEVSEETCRQIGDVLARLGDKWTVLILVTLAQGSRRFSELDREVGTVSQKMLAATLRGLERDGYVTRTLTAGVPPRVDYALTDLGREVLPHLFVLAEWAFAKVELIGGNRARFDRSRGGEAGKTTRAVRKRSVAAVTA